MIHRDYFAADGTARNRMHGQTHHGISGGSATNAVYVVLVMRLLSPHYAATCNSV